MGGSSEERASSLPSPVPSSPLSSVPSPTTPDPRAFERAFMHKAAPASAPAPAPKPDSDSEMSDLDDEPKGGVLVVIEPPTRESSYAPPPSPSPPVPQSSHRQPLSSLNVDPRSSPNSTSRTSPPARPGTIHIASCDRCRKHKAKCDSKFNKNPYAACSRCKEFGVACEFKDRDSLPMASSKPRAKPRRRSAGLDDGGTSSDGGSSRRSRTRGVHTETEEESTDTEVRRRPYARRTSRPAASELPKVRFASGGSQLVPTEVRYANMPPPSPASQLPPAPVYQPSYAARFRNASEGGRPLALNVPVNSFSAHNAASWSGVPSPARSLPPPSPLPPNLAGPWNHWELPSSITGDNGCVELLPAELINLLIARFFDEPSASAAFVGQRSIMSRMDPQSGLPTVPEYLLLTIAAVAAGFPTTPEPELHAWYSTGWLRACESVFARSQEQEAGRVQPEVELIQALLLLTVNWAGPPARLERFNTFTLACSLFAKLQSSPAYIDSAEIRALYWALYVTDNLMTMARGDGQPGFHAFGAARPDFRLILSLGGVSSLGGSDTNTTDVFELSQLFSVAIDLAGMHEAIIKSLHSPHITKGTLHQLLSRQSMFERQLRLFVSENRLLLMNPQHTQPLNSQARVLAQGIISLLHITQIALYQAPLRYEIKTSPTEACYNQYVNISFAPECTNSLAACIESAWHLIHQPYVTQATLPLLTAQGCIEAAAIADAVEHMDFAMFGRVCGAEFFRFLECHWLEWQGGVGCMLYAPLLVGPTASQPPPPPAPAALPPPPASPGNYAYGAAPKPRHAQVPGQSSPTAISSPYSTSMAPPYSTAPGYNAQPGHASSRPAVSSALAPPPTPGHAVLSRKSAPPPITLTGAELRRQDGLTTPMLASLGLPLTPARQVYDSLAANALAAAGYTLPTRLSPRSGGVASGVGIVSSPRTLGFQRSPRSLSLQHPPRSVGMQRSPRPTGSTSPSNLAQSLLSGSRAWDRRLGETVQTPRATQLPASDANADADTVMQT